MNNWMIALPEIVLAVTGLAILIIGVLRKQDAVLVCTMLAIGGFLVADLARLAAEEVGGHLAGERGRGGEAERAAARAGELHCGEPRGGGQRGRGARLRRVAEQEGEPLEDLDGDFAQDGDGVGLHGSSRAQAAGVRKRSTVALSSSGVMGLVR